MSDVPDRSPPQNLDAGEAVSEPRSAPFDTDPLWYDTETEPDQAGRSRLGPVAVGGIVLVGIGVVAWMIQS